MGGVSVSVSSTAAMNGVSQTGAAGGGINYWTEPNAADRPYTGGTVSNAPTAREQIGLNSANSYGHVFFSHQHAVHGPAERRPARSTGHVRL